MYQHLLSQASQYHTSREGGGRSDEIPVDVAPSDHSSDEEWCTDEVDLKTVTITKMSIDSKHFGTDGKRGRYREITIDSGSRKPVVNPDGNRQRAQ